MEASGTQVDTRHAIGEDSVAVVHVTDLGDDPEVSALMGALFQVFWSSIKQDQAHRDSRAPEALAKSR